MPINDGGSMAHIVKLRSRSGTSTLELSVPTEMVNSLNLEAGSYFSVTTEDGAIIFTPVQI